MRACVREGRQAGRQTHSRSVKQSGRRQTSRHNAALFDDHGADDLVSPLDTHTHTHTDEGRDIGKGCDGNTDAMQVRDVI